MRVAVCMYGQPRTWRSCVEWIQDNYAHGANPEYFCSVKNYNTDKFTDEIEILEDIEVNELLDVYKPALHFIEKYGTFAGAGAFSSMIQSIVSTINLKQQYELQHGMLFDYVVLQRYDAIGGPHTNWLGEVLSATELEPMTILSSNPHIYFGPEAFKRGVGDLILVGHNTAMDALAGNLINNFNPGEYSVKTSDYHFVSPSVSLLEACTHHNILVRHMDLNPIVIRPTSDLSNGFIDSWHLLDEHWKPKD